MDLQPEGHSIAMLTGAHAAKAVVIFHGYTVLPEQFRLVGDAYRAQGYNVWIPRLPRHGMAEPDDRRVLEDHGDGVARLRRQPASTSAQGWATN